MTDKEKILQIFNERNICYTNYGDKIVMYSPDIVTEKIIYNLSVIRKIKMYLNFDAAGRFTNFEIE